MNQILSINNNQSNGTNNSGNSRKARKIIVFFAIAIIIFGLAIAGVYIYKEYENKKGSQSQIAEPTIELTQEETSVKILATYEGGIEKLTYYWDPAQRNELSVNASTTYEKLIEIPEGNNNLTVELQYASGKIKEVSQEFSNTASIINAPKIEAKEIEGKNLKIVVTDDSLTSIAYHWNDEETDVVVEAGEDKTKIEVPIEIRRGKNTLTIKAIDTDGNEETLSQTIKGVNQPEINVKRYGNEVRIAITHDMGIKKVIFTINDVEYVYDENTPSYDKTKTELSYSLKIEEGVTTIKIVAESNEIVNEMNNEGSTATFKGKSTYNPNEE